MQPKSQCLQAENMLDICNTGSETAPLISQSVPGYKSTDSSLREFFEADPPGLVAGISIHALRKVLCSLWQLVIEHCENFGGLFSLMFKKGRLTVIGFLMRMLLLLLLLLLFFKKYPWVYSFQALKAIKTELLWLLVWIILGQKGVVQKNCIELLQCHRQMLEQEVSLLLPDTLLMRTMS